MHGEFVAQRLFLPDYLNSQTVVALPSLTASRVEIVEIIDRVDRLTMAEAKS